MLSPEGPRTKYVPVFCELVEEPGSPNAALSRVTRDVDLPDPEANFSISELYEEVVLQPEPERPRPATRKARPQGGAR
jgi:hypothetical protein